jgi:5'-phosphate synthase pdxT subunit
MTVAGPDVTVGVLALQGAFSEHVQLLRAAAESLALKGAPASAQSQIKWSFVEVRTPAELGRCDGLIVPGGESTAISLVAARSGLLEPLRDFVKYAPRTTHYVQHRH